jgi:hypothetical protein
VRDGISSISLPRLVEDRPGAKDIHVREGLIAFDHVRFHYGKKKGVIEDLSLTVAPGEKVGIVGRSGAGKSTLVNLLLRFYDIESGKILIDGQDIGAVTQDSLRAQIGMVTQDTSLLHRSVRDNILYGRPDATEEQMLAAARRAEAHEFIGSLTDPRAARLRRACRRARREALRWPAAARRHCPRDAEGCADPDARRGDLGAGFGSGGRDPGEPLSPDGRQDGDRHRPPLVHHRGDGPADRHGQGSRHRGRHA